MLYDSKHSLQMQGVFDIYKIIWYNAESNMDNYANRGLRG